MLKKIIIILSLALPIPAMAATCSNYYGAVQSKVNAHANAQLVNYQQYYEEGKYRCSVVVKVPAIQYGMCGPHTAIAVSLEQSIYNIFRGTGLNWNLHKIKTTDCVGELVQE